MNLKGKVRQLIEQNTIDKGTSLQRLRLKRMAIYYSCFRIDTLLDYNFVFFFDNKLSIVASFTIYNEKELKEWFK